jgi:hypothetical protein
MENKNEKEISNIPKADIETHFTNEEVLAHINKPDKNESGIEKSIEIKKVLTEIQNIQQKPNEESPESSSPINNTTPDNLLQSKKAVTVFRGLHNVSEEEIEKIINNGLSPKITANPIITAKELKKNIRNHVLGSDDVGNGLQSFTNSPLSADGFAQTSPFKDKNKGVFGWLGVLAKKLKLSRGQSAENGNYNIIIETVIPKSLIVKKHLLSLQQLPMAENLWFLEM